MKNNCSFPFLLTLILLLSVNYIYAGTWENKPFENKLFIENLGQFDAKSNPGISNVKFFAENQGCQLYFTPKGLSYHFDFYDKLREKKKGDTFKKHRKKSITSRSVNVEWVGANPDVRIIAEDKAPEYFVYSIGVEKVVTHANAFKKIVYKNLYPKIDVEYVFHPIEGIKYNIVLHPGADASLIKMKYTGDYLPSVDLKGNISIRNSEFAIKDHAPVTFYESKGSISSKYLLKDGVVSFELEEYDTSQKVIIDPWTTTITTLSGNNRAFDIGKDAAGNIYVGGGKGLWPNGYNIAKFNSSGTLVWTTNTGLDGYYGDMVVDPSGNCYIAEGAYLGRVRKFNTSGTQVWASTVHSGAGGYEVWALAMNDAGTALAAAWIDNGYSFRVGYLNMATGAITSSSAMGLSNTELRALCFDPSGSLFGLSCNFSSGGVGNRLLSATGALSKNYFVASGYAWEEWSTTYSNQNNFTGSGVNMVCADANYVYTSNGATLHKRNKSTGAIIASVAIPNGVFERNGGITVDGCGTIYVGSRNFVYEFDNTLTQTDVVATPNHVYDVMLGSTAGEVLACGRQFVASLSFSPCIILPVKLNAFNVNCVDRNVVCEWSTLTETNNDYFTLEKSLDGVKFDFVAEVNGSGNSNVVKEYRVKDDSPFNEGAYYRLKQTSYDGVSEYFNMRKINCTSENQANVYPSPFNKFLDITFDQSVKSNYRVELKNSLGQTVMVRVFPQNSKTVRLSIDEGLPKGVYFIKIFNSHRVMYNRKVMKL